MIRLRLRRYRYAARILQWVAIAYLVICLALFWQQRHLIFRPGPYNSLLPSSLAFKLPYSDVWIPVSGTTERLHGWWVPASAQRFVVLPNEPVNSLKSPKVMLYLCGIGRNMGDYNYLARVAAMRQLGFSVLVVDYRGYGRSDGGFPSEAQVYQDSQAAWQYLVRQQIPPRQIVIYGESLGGAIALDLAVRHPEARGLILQSTFTSMADKVKHTGLFWLFPVDLLLNQRFDSLTKIRSLRVPVLLIHGTADPIVPFTMSQQLYAAAPEPKQLFLIPGAGHIRIYQPEHSYLKAIDNFINNMPSTRG